MKPRDGEPCPICRRETPSRDFVSDHCHETEISRAWICRSCNAGLGMFKDDPKALRRAAAYVRYHRKRADVGLLEELRRAYQHHPRA